VANVVTISCCGKSAAFETRRLLEVFYSKPISNSMFIRTARRTNRHYKFFNRCPLNILCWIFVFTLFYKLEFC